MTEKEKAEAGLLYDANYDIALLAERASCKAMCYEYNRRHPSDTAGRVRIIYSPGILNY